MFIEIVTLGAFLVICLIAFLIGDTIGGGRRTAQNVIDANAGQFRRGKAPSALRTAITTSLARVVPQSAGEVRKIERDLKRAGYYRTTALVEYMATRNALVVGALITFGLLAVLADPSSTFPQMLMVVGVLTACLGYGFPRLVLSFQAKRRVERIQRGLPDALDIIHMCLTGGLPLREAFKRVAHEIKFFHRDIAVELDIIHRQADADTMSHALKQFARRIDAPDVNALSALVAQTDRMGTHVATAVSEYADSVRLAYRQRAEERANKTSIKLLFPVIVCLAPLVYILLCGPPMLKMRNFLIESHQPGGIFEQIDVDNSITPNSAVIDLGTPNEG